MNNKFKRFFMVCLAVSAITALSCVTAFAAQTPITFDAADVLTNANLTANLQNIVDTMVEIVKFVLPASIALIALRKGLGFLKGMVRGA